MIDQTRRKVKLLHPHPAMLLLSEKTFLVISDLHIGFEERFTSKGIRIPSSTVQMLDELQLLLTRNHVDEMIILGDVKYTVEGISDTEWREVPRFLEQASKLTKVTVIPGNHDGSLKPLLPKNVEVSEEPYLILGDTALLHGHTIPPESLKDSARIVMGHLHPTYSRRGSPISGKQVWLVIKAKRKSLFPSEDGEVEVYVLPSFNRDLAPLGFTSNRGKIISPVIRRVEKDILQMAVVTLEGDIIGDQEAVPYVL